MRFFSYLWKAYLRMFVEKWDRQLSWHTYYLFFHYYLSLKGGLKLSIQKTKIMASSPITSWQMDGETVETVANFIFGGSKITVDGDCSHETKRCLLLGRKVMTNLLLSHFSRVRLCATP